MQVAFALDLVAQSRVPATLFPTVLILGLRATLDNLWVGTCTLWATERPVPITLVRFGLAPAARSHGVELFIAL